MKINGNFNKISDKLKGTIPVLKPGEVVTFQLLNGVKNPDPDPKEQEKYPMLYGKINIPTNDRIFDPNLNGEDKGGYVDIGCVDYFEKDNNPVFRFFYPGMGHHIFMGKFSLTGGNVKDEELFEFFFLCNRNESNPNRDKSIEPLFKMVNAIQDSKESTGKFAILKRAINISSEIKESAARKIAASLNWPDYKDWDVLKAEVEKYASRNPDKFLAVYDDPTTTEVKAYLKRAIDANLVTYDFASGQVKYGESLLTTLPQTKDLLGDLFSWQQSAKNGEQVLESMRKQLDKKDLPKEPEVVA